ncbi:hypothetical protein PYW08_006815 [Mythimna loreyi]|uniref:Uncharacterized protein n=1 Tax=Mythimna loreyi TaxID=667449 RepID=A0ACC2R8Y3_9NEOP|nr:hypothetical protein PYW08_006815 [Mythimna loreyi]
MCKNVPMVPMKKSVDSAIQKSCKPAMLGRMWQASRRALNLEHSPAHQFACSQWQSSPHPSTAYLIYRWLLFLSVLSIGVASFACQRLPRLYEGPKIELNYMKWFIYFTNWGYMLIALQSALALAVVHRYRAQKSDSPCEEDEIPIPLGRRTRTPLLCRAYWLAHNIATDLAFVITLVYWALIHDPKIHEINTLNVLVHGGNSLVMVVELAVTSHPVRAAHALHSAGAGLAYGVFSAFYWAVGGTDRVGLPAIYPALDWNKPGSAFGFVSLCAVVLVFAHALATCAAAARARLASSLRSRPSAERLALPTH